MLVADFKTMIHYLLPKQRLTILAGLLAEVKITWIKNYLIKQFIKRFSVNMSEALEENPEKYPNFNEFFIRRLKPACRPLAEADIISPVDGAVSEIGKIEKGQLLQAKGRYYTVSELLGTEAPEFDQGSFATLYLSPKDYHRIHMPIDATLSSMTHLPGALFSVQPATTQSIPKLFARNERLVIFFNTRYGKMAMVLVGATIVGAIGTTWHGELKRSLMSKSFQYDHPEVMIKTFYEKAEEMGYFKLGSTVILLFEECMPIQWENSLKAGVTVKMGQSLASL